MLSLMIGSGSDSGSSSGGCDTPTPTGIIFDGSYTMASRSDLQALAGYTEITQGLQIAKSDVVNLDDLELLTKIGGSLEIWENSVLENIDGLGNLKIANCLDKPVANGSLAINDITLSL